MIIRDATHDDLETIIDMGEKLQQESREFEPLLTFNWHESYEHYVKEMNNEDARIIIADDPVSGIIGYQYSFMSNLDYLAEKNRECMFEALYVKPEHRGKGVARKLVHTAEQWAVEEMHADRIKAGIYSGNIASEVVHLQDGFESYYTEYIKLTNTNE